MRYKFKNTFCSQCGEEFGPGDHGFSSCKSHRGMNAGAMNNKKFEAIRIRIMEEAYELADRNDAEGYNSVKLMCGDVKILLGDKMNENTVSDTEILKCERSNLIEALQGLINLIDIKSPRLRETSGYAHAKNVLEKIS